MTTGFYTTRAARQALQFLGDCRSGSPRVALLAGAPGSGKTTICSEYVRAAQERRPGSVLRATCTPGAGVVNLLQGLLDELSPGPRVPSARAGLARLAAAVRRHDVRLVLLDEAQHLYKTPLEMLRMLHLRAPVSLVLSGPLPELRERLRIVPALFHHVDTVHTLGSLTSDEVESVASLHRVSPRALPVLQSACEGNWDLLLRVLERSRERALRPPRVSVRHVEDAARATGMPTPEGTINPREVRDDDAA